jgi:hypothetical protein
MPLTIGVLIIGSLYWRLKGRETWRRWRLDTGHKWLVKAPIRYGRRSQNRTYTMVFWPECQEEELGQAIVVQCQRRVASSGDLVNEAEWLWSAEVNDVPSLCCLSPKRGISATWGCVALLRNPHSQVPRDLLADWAAHVARHYQAANSRLVDTQGMLQIPWPNLSWDDSPVPMDLLLATSNDRERTFPTAKAIADAWNQHPETVEYFRKNRESEIYTFQDREIEELLH